MGHSARSGSTLVVPQISLFVGVSLSACPFNSNAQKRQIQMKVSSSCVVVSRDRKAMVTFFQLGGLRCKGHANIKRGIVVMAMWQGAWLLSSNAQKRQIQMKVSSSCVAVSRDRKAMVIFFQLGGLRFKGHANIKRGSIVMAMWQGAWLQVKNASRKAAQFLFW